MKRFCEEYPSVVSTNGDIRRKREEEEKKGFFFLPDFTLSGGPVFGRLAFAFLPAQVYPKEKLTHFPSRQEPELFFFYFLGHCFTEVFQSLHD